MASVQRAVDCFRAGRPAVAVVGDAPILIDTTPSRRKVFG